MGYSKAYDFIPCQVMLRILKLLGCGAVTLAELVSMYAVIKKCSGCTGGRGDAWCPPGITHIMLLINYIHKLSH